MLAPVTLFVNTGEKFQTFTYGNMDGSGRREEDAKEPFCSDFQDEFMTLMVDEMKHEILNDEEKLPLIDQFSKKMSADTAPTCSSCGIHQLERNGTQFYRDIRLEDLLEEF